MTDTKRNDDAPVTVAMLRKFGEGLRPWCNTDREMTHREFHAAITAALASLPAAPAQQEPREPDWTSGISTRAAFIAMRDYARAQRERADRLEAELREWRERDYEFRIVKSRDDERVTALTRERDEARARLARECDQYRILQRDLQVTADELHVAEAKLADAEARTRAACVEALEKQCEAWDHIESAIQFADEFRERLRALGPLRSEADIRQAVLDEVGKAIQEKADEGYALGEFRNGILAARGRVQSLASQPLRTGAKEK